MRGSSLCVCGTFTNTTPSVGFALLALIRRLTSDHSLRYRPVFFTRAVLAFAGSSQSLAWNDRPPDRPEMFPPIAFQPVGRMVRLQERVHGMTVFCRAVASELANAKPQLRAMAGSLQLQRVRRIHVLVSIDDIPLPEMSDRLAPDGTLLIHMQTVGASEEGDRLFPDFVYGGWWHIGLHEYDAFAWAMTARAAAPPEHPQLFWTGNVEMSPSRAALVAMSQAHPGRIDARGMRWAHARGNVTEATGERAATDGWVSLQRHAEWRYLIDVEGMGWSGRLKLLPHAGRALIVRRSPPMQLPHAAPPCSPTVQPYHAATHAALPCSRPCSPTVPPFCAALLCRPTVQPFCAALHAVTQPTEPQRRAQPQSSAPELSPTEPAHGARAGAAAPLLGLGLLAAAAGGALRAPRAPRARAAARRARLARQPPRRGAGHGRLVRVRVRVS